MENLKHTPGPWHIMKGGFVLGNKPSDCVAAVYATNDNLEIIVKVHEDRLLCHGARQDAMANAKLIAAAPKLLEACLAAKNELNRNGLFGCTILDEAIKKATE